MIVFERKFRYIVAKLIFLVVKQVPWKIGQ